MAAYEDWTDEELRAVLRFQEFSRAWLEEHLEKVEELRRQQQPRPNAVRAALGTRAFGAYQRSV